MMLQFDDSSVKRSLSVAPGMFRPQDLTIRKPDAAAEGTTVLFGHVQHREFLGSFIRYAVQVGEHVILVDDSHQAGRPVFDIGDDVAIGLVVDQVRVPAD